MCGIVGFFLKNEEIQKDTLMKATQSLIHRGPDCQKTWLSPNRRVGLGHTRLSIIDLTSGDQPLSNEDNTIHAVVNGEFYGFQEIRSELEKKGHFFKTRSDSEILLHLYEEYGTHCVQKLRGEFAFILWDENNRTLFAGRDRFGIKPLYYSQSDSRIIFASEIKALFAAGIDAKWDLESCQFSDSFLTPPEDRTLFQGIYQVPPGHTLLATQNSSRILKYWDFNYPEAAVKSMPLTDTRQKESIEEFRSVLDEAVRLRLHADVPIACYLSGGLDSCAVLGLAASHSSQPIQAFTLGFDHDDYDETEIARRMAEKAGAVFNPIPMSQEGLADHFSEAVYHAETPLMNAHGVAKFLLSKAVSQAGYKVVLTGEGSDEVLGGYPHFRKDKLLQMQRSGSPKVDELLKELELKNKVSAALLLATQTTVHHQRMTQTLGFIPSWIDAYAGTGIAFAQLYKPSYKNQVGHFDAIKRLLDTLDIPGQVQNREAIHQSMYLWSKVFLPNYILSVLGDRMEMSHSIEGRVPFLDHRVVECAVQLPAEMKISGMNEKFVLREATKNKITQEIYERQKHPFLSPPAALKKEGKLFQLLQDTVSSQSFSEQPFFEPNEIKNLIKTVSNQEDPLLAAKADPFLTRILSIGLLKDRFAVV